MDDNPALIVLRIGGVIGFGLVVRFVLRRAWDAGLIHGVFAFALKATLFIAALALIGFCTSSIDGGGGGGHSSCGALTARYC